MSRVQALVGELDDELKGAGDADRAVNEKRYLKSPLRHYGVTVPAIRKTVKGLLKAEGQMTGPERKELVRQLWASDLHEWHMAAVILMEEWRRRLEQADIDLVEEMIDSSFTWAYVDSLAVFAAGGLVERFPELNDRLDVWAHAENFWLRRAAMLALLGPLRAGGGDWQRFQRYADSMLAEREFFIRKAIGWVLRETSKKRPGLVRDYVASRLDKLSALSFREAVKRLPEAERVALQEAYARR